MLNTPRRGHSLVRLFERHEVFSVAVALGVAVIAFDQFLHTSPAQFGAAPAFQVFRWVSSTLMALPLFAAAVWAGHLIADRVGLGSATRRDLFERALLISGSLAVFLTPGWFAYYEVASLTQNGDLVAAHSHAPNHSIDAYWVSDKVVYALLLAPLTALAVWGGYRIAAGFGGRLAGRTGALARSCVVAMLLGGVGAAAWFLHQAAIHADSSRVYYTGAATSPLVHSHAFFANGHGAPVAPVPPAPAAPFSFAYQVARALQDGLIAQVVGLPLVLLTLLWGARVLHARDRYRHEGSEPEEVATR